MGVITDLIPGRDGVVRSAVLRTANGELRRPVQKLYPLEVNELDESPTQETDNEIEESPTQETDNEIEKSLTQETDNELEETGSNSNPQGGSVKTRVGRVLKKPARYR